MSYLSTAIPEVKKTQVVRLNDKEVFPDGQHFIIFGVGEVEKNSSNNDYWDNSAQGEEMEAIPKMECTLWIDEIGENGGFLNWLYTGSDNDIANVLGWDDPQMDTIKELNPGSKLKYAIKQPQKTYFVPVLKVAAKKEGKKTVFDVENGQMLHLILSNGQFEKILTEARKFAIEDESDMKGRLIQIDINRASRDRGAIYTFAANTRMYTAEEYPELHERFDNERLAIIEGIEKQIQAVHNGVWGDPNASAAEVWKNLIERSGLTVDEIMAKYYAGPKSRLIDNNGTSGLDLEDFSLEE